MTSNENPKSFPESRREERMLSFAFVHFIMRFKFLPESSHHLLKKFKWPSERALCQATNLKITDTARRLSFGDRWMTPVKQETVPIASSADVVMARQKVRQWASEMKFTLVDQTKLVTAASELARNALEHGKGGHMVIEKVENSPKNGLKLVFEDKGPGIKDIEAALRDGFTTGGGMGLGLGGSKRLVNDFQIESEPGKGTRITVVRWK